MITDRPELAIHLHRLFRLTDEPRNFYNFTIEERALSVPELMTRLIVSYVADPDDIEYQLHLDNPIFYEVLHEGFSAFAAPPITFGAVCELRDSDMISKISETWSGKTFHWLKFRHFIFHIPDFATLEVVATSCERKIKGPQKRAPSHLPI